MQCLLTSVCVRRILTLPTEGRAHDQHAGVPDTESVQHSSAVNTRRIPCYSSAGIGSGSPQGGRSQGAQPSCIIVSFRTVITAEIENSTLHTHDRNSQKYSQLISDYDTVNHNH